MMKSKTLRYALMAGAAAFVLGACSDTDISSPGTPVVTPPANPAPPPPPPPPTATAIVEVPDSYAATVAARNELSIVNIDTDDGNFAEVVAIQGPVVADLTLIAGVPYYVDSTVFIGQDAGTGATEGTGITLTIDPGATIYGNGPTAGVVVNRGSDIDADGNAANPIVFTSFNELQRENGALPADSEADAEWLGLVINGFAPINNCNDSTATPGAADCQDDGEAASGLYGGGDAADNSGTLNYVRVEFAGVFYTEEDQSNGIAFQGVGNGTDVSWIQVHNNGDDGVEFFGGTVNAQNVAITGAADDAIDWTDGWTGSLQRAVVTQRTGDGDYAIEGDNRSRSASDRTPRSNPTVTNFTFVGNGDERAIRLREGTAGNVVNGIVTNWTAALRVADPETFENMTTAQPDGASLDIESLITNTGSLTANTTLDDNGTPDDTTDDTVFDATQIIPFLVNVTTEEDEVAVPGFQLVPGLATGNAQKVDANGELVFVITDAGTSTAMVGDEVNETELATLTANDNALGVGASPVTATATLGTQVFPIADLGRAELEDNNYIGAFGPDETVDSNWAAGWTRPGSLFEGATNPTGVCPTSTNITLGGTLGGEQVCILSGVITEDLTLNTGVIYRLSGLVSVGQDGGSAATNATGTAQANLTIPAGVTLFGNSPSDGLVVTRGSTIDATGTAAEPIVFTSGAAVAGGADYVNDTAQWLGLSLNGKAPLNRCNDAMLTPGTEGCERNGEGGSGLYGGGIGDDGSGTLRYVRVEFAGIFINEEDQSNGIQFNGTGSGTDVSFVQVHNNGDDGIEFFGGTTDIRYAVVTGARDDSVDWTDGWQGDAQFLIIEHFDGDYAFEGDNRSESAPNQAPISTPDIANFTIVSALEGRGARLREGSRGALVNGIFANTTLGVDLDDDAAVAGGTIQALLDDELTIASHYITSAAPVVDDAGEALTAAQILAEFSNVTAGDSSMSGFSFYGRADTGVIPGANETAVTTFDPSDLNATGETFFEAANFLGAVPSTGDNTEWYLGWTVDSQGNVTSTGN
ncbi:MAG: hypothetical protein AAFQ22_05310 [Pseudomonadota bacterium]